MAIRGSVFYVLHLRLVSPSESEPRSKRGRDWARGRVEMALITNDWHEAMLQVMNAWTSDIYPFFLIYWVLHIHIRILLRKMALTIIGPHDIYRYNTPAVFNIYTWRFRVVRSILMIVSSHSALPIHSGALTFFFQSWYILVPHCGYLRCPTVALMPEGKKYVGNMIGIK